MKDGWRWLDEACRGLEESDDDGAGNGGCLSSGCGKEQRHVGCVEEVMGWRGLMNTGTDEQCQSVHDAVDATGSW